ncbi:hemolysin III family protein [Rhodocyclus tenuis]|uniref:Hemolysin III family protein n=2 Tax=Rhodocyclus TaxID=1064 RepID=A0A6L5JXL3_RHOTE|nr:hemolysin III family protein [Rhodocyclus gracilis]MQY50938.1 hemolysin III family protein [Rhodocyclus gracilis]NJA88649.1 hemolysin III family protein [Rhodocyclus gracilis]
MYYGERFNAISHLVGAVLALSGSVLLVVRTLLAGDRLALIGVLIYSATLVLLYSISTAYHSVRGRLKGILRKLDHQAIYLLIAGSYTPFCLITLRDDWGLGLLGGVWALAAIGMLQEMRSRSKARVLSLLIYLAMGWVALLVIRPLIARLGEVGFAWLALGGLLYTVGIVFFVFDERFRHWHGIWHLFVVAGSAVHFAVIFFYVV